MWKYDLSASFEQKLQLIATFQGHDKNVTSVYFGPKRASFFTSVS